MYTACTVIIAAHMFPSILKSIPAAALGESVQKGYRVLQHYETYTMSARKRRNALDFIQRKVMGATAAANAAEEHPEADAGAGVASVDPFFGGSDFDPSFIHADIGDIESTSSGWFPWDQDMSWLGTALQDWRYEST
jgi:hypothetical protein